MLHSHHEAELPFHNQRKEREAKRPVKKAKVGLFPRSEMSIKKRLRMGRVGSNESLPDCNAVAWHTSLICSSLGSFCCYLSPQIASQGLPAGSSMPS